MLGFCIPYIVNLFCETNVGMCVVGRSGQDLSLDICMCTQALFFAIEISQMIQQRFSYFVGWNLTDFGQFCIFTSIYVLDKKRIPTSYDAELAFLMVVLTFMKILSFMRIFERYGFLV